MAGSDAESEHEDEPMPQFRIASDRTTKSERGKKIISKYFFSEDVIPDADAIYRARKARERARLGLGEPAENSGQVIRLSETRPLDDTQRYKKEK